jgi:hypothetical protein
MLWLLAQNCMSSSDRKPSLWNIAWKTMRLFFGLQPALSFWFLDRFCKAFETLIHARSRRFSWTIMDVSCTGWESLDVDHYIPGLIDGVFGTRKWMAAMGASGGAARTEAKRTSSRENGRKGGRPRGRPRKKAA